MTEQERKKLIKAKQTSVEDQIQRRAGKYPLYSTGSRVCPKCGSIVMMGRCSNQDCDYRSD